KTTRLASCKDVAQWAADNSYASSKYVGWFYACFKVDESAHTRTDYKHVDGNWYRCSEQTSDRGAGRRLMIVTSISSEYVEFLRRENIVEEGQGASATASSGPDQHYYEAGKIIVASGNGATNPFVTGFNNATNCMPQAKTLNLRGVIQDTKR